MTSVKYFDNKDLRHINSKYTVKNYKKELSKVHQDSYKHEQIPKYMQQLISIKDEHYDYYENIKIFKKIKDTSVNLKQKCKLIKKEGFTICNIPKGTLLFKGMRYFFTKDYEEQYIKNNNIKEIWLGTIKIGAVYADRYQGGLNVYKVKKNLNLLVISNYNNLKKLYKLLKKSNEKKAFCLKFGVGCDVNEQIKNILEINRWKDEIWITNEIIKEDNYFYNKKIRQYGIGSNDRVVSKIIKKYLGEIIDGWISYETYTPYTYHGKLSGEILLFDYNKLSRDTQHPLDWYQWKNELPIKISPNFMLNSNFMGKNSNFRFTNFYNNHKYKPIKYKNNYKILTLNVHYLESINEYDTRDDCYKYLIKLLEDIDADIIGLQEFPEKYIKKLKKTKYNIIYTPNGSHNNALNCILLTKHKITKFKIIKQYEGIKKRNSIYAIISNKYSVILTHFPIGKRYNSLNYPELLKIYKTNVKTRIKFLKTLLRYKPNFLIGDMNFNPVDIESKFIRNKTNYSKSMKQNIKSIKYSSGYGILVDYILFNNHINIKNPKYKAIKYPYSDHLPVLLCFNK